MRAASFLRFLLPRSLEQRRYPDGKYAPSQKRLDAEARKRETTAALRRYVAEDKMRRLRFELAGQQAYEAVEAALAVDTIPEPLDEKAADAQSSGPAPRKDAEPAAQDTSAALVPSTPVQIEQHEHAA